jgi:hypothetical protein
MSLIWYQTCVEAECHDCGERRSCTRVTSEREHETGYIDEVELCADCMAKRRRMKYPYDDPFD